MTVEIPIPLILNLLKDERKKLAAAPHRPSRRALPSFPALSTVIPA